jgi:hypothetical protein
MAVATALNIRTWNGSPCPSLRRLGRRGVSTGYQSAARSAMSKRDGRLPVRNASRTASRPSNCNHLGQGLGEGQSLDPINP